ncbi:MAG: WbqC family protein [Bdellovibrionales bacterium]
MRTVVILQPSYLPWLGYFDQMRQADAFVLYDDVQFDKHGWRNRNRVKSPRGEPYWLTVPVKHKGLGKPLIQDILINNDQPWAHKQSQTLRLFYTKAPHAKEYLPQLAEILAQPWGKLMDLNVAVLQWMMQLLKLKTEIHKSSALGVEGGQTGRLVKICQHFAATHYLSGNAAKEYLDVEQFRQAKIEVAWHDYMHPNYPQLHGNFISHLSALDLLLNVGAESHKYLFFNDFSGRPKQ